MTLEQLTSECQNKYGGVMDGGRCFWIANSTANWTAAWSLCQAAGATLAQLHTSSEYGKVVTKYQVL